MINRRLRVFILFSVLLSACGQQGPLFMPIENETIVGEEVVDELGVDEKIEGEPIENETIVDEEIVDKLGVDEQVDSELIVDEEMVDELGVDEQIDGESMESEIIEIKPIEKNAMENSKPETELD